MVKQAFPLPPVKDSKKSLDDNSSLKPVLLVDFFFFIKNVLNGMYFALTKFLAIL